MFTSKLRIVSIGIAAENKPLSSRQIQVVPIEMVPMLEGEIVDNITESQVTGQDRLDQQYNVTIKASSTITAEWLPYATNRITPPDIRRGERVVIWQVADSDKYYWQETGMDDELRRLETIIYAVSATRDETVELDPAENMYSLEISTHNHHVTFQTTDADGEATTYRVQFNTADGDFHFIDKQGNTVSVNSTEHQIFVKNADDCHAHFNKEDMQINVPNNLTATIGNNVDYTVGGNVTGKVEGNVDETVKGNVTLQVDGNVDVTVGGDVTGEVQGSVEATVSGDVTAQVTGNVEITSSGEINAQAVGNAALTAGGNVNLSAGGGLIASNGAASLSMNGPAIELN